MPDFDILPGRKLLLFLSILLMAVGIMPVHGQNVFFTSLTSNEGLSSNTIYCVLKDRYGFMWFGTDDGLDKYDGISFTSYRHDPSNKNSLPVNEITCLHEDRAGRLWIGTNGGSVSLYDRKRDSFTTLPGTGGSNALISKAITSISSDNRGRIWIGTFGGLNLYYPRSGKVVKFSARASERSSLISNTISQVFKDSKGNMWIGTPRGLHLSRGGSDKFIRFLHGSDSSTISSDAIKTITEDSEGNIWVGTVRGLNVLMKGRTGFRRFRSSSNANSISGDYITAVEDDRQGSLWVGTEEGVSIIQVSTGNVVRIKPDKRNQHSLTSKSIRSILIDDKHIYWLGTYQGGVNKYDPNLTFFNQRGSNSFDPFSLRVPVVTSFSETENGDLFVGTDGGGLHLYERRKDLFRRIDFPLNSSRRSSELSVLALHRSGRSKLWIGTYNEGVIVYDLADHSVRHLKDGNGALDLSSNDIFCFYETADGEIWVGTNGGGIDVLESSGKRIRKYISTSTMPDRNNPSNNNVRDFAGDKEGHIWIATYGGGISMFDRKTGKFRAYNAENSGLAGDVVLSLLCDKRGNLWAGTSGGLCFLNKKSQRFITYSEKDGLSNNLVQKIIEDEVGNIWLSTNRGLSKFDVQTRTFKNYSTYNGLQDSPFMTGSGIKLSDGTIFFGGFKGLNYFNPKHLRTNNEVPVVLFTGLKVSGKNVLPAEHGSPLRESIASANEIVLDYKQSFSLSFAALNYTSPQQNRYAWILEGFDKDWNPQTNNPVVSYTSLAPGKYTFRVKASNNDGIWNEKGATIQIIIKPPFWRTTWAYLVYVLILSLCLLYIVRTGTQKLKKKFAIEQERKEAERLRELDRLKLKFLTNISHEFRTPISLIMAPADKLLASPSIDKESSSQLFIIKRNARRLLNLVNQLLDFRKMEEQELKLNLSEGELVSFVREIVESFADLAERKKIHYDFKSALETLYTNFDHDKVERILFNLLSNAFKFTYERGEVEIDLQLSRESEENLKWISIRIKDTGIGIARERHEKIFERFFQDEVSSAILNQGSGIGLSITREFVKMQGGDIWVESEPGLGSTFVVELPFKDISSLQASAEDSLEKELHTIKEPVDGVGTLLPNHEQNVPHILIVEDNTDFRFYLKDNLKSHYRISEASDGKEGFQKALSLHPQLIVSDISMPLMDGIELCRKIKSDKRTSHIPVILLTAIAGESEQLKGLETGANDYMTKPFNFEILSSKIKNLLVLQNVFRETYTRQLKVQPAEPELISEDTRFLSIVVTYIEDNLNNDKLSVEDLSHHISTSRGTLYRRILNLTGETPVEFIRSVKLEKARMLLEKSDLTIAQIGYMVGFSTPNYFTKAFRIKYNILPSQYIKLKRKHKPPGDQE